MQLCTPQQIKLTAFSCIFKLILTDATQSVHFTTGEDNSMIKLGKVSAKTMGGAGGFREVDNGICLPATQDLDTCS